MTIDHKDALTKVPEVTLTFWIIKIAATTLGETGGDSVTMTLLHADANAHNGGYLIGTALFFSILVALVIWQIAAKRFHPFLYWAHDCRLDNLRHDDGRFRRPLAWASATPAARRCCCSVCSRFWLSGTGREGSISVETVATPRVEAFYWAAITFSQTLGTALGDWMADSTGLGYEGGALVFGAALAVLAILYFRTNMSRVLLFWAAFILTRPLGATVGDFLDKPINHGGLALSRPLASAVIAVFIIVCIVRAAAARRPPSGACGRGVLKASSKG